MCIWYLYFIANAIWILFRDRAKAQCSDRHMDQSIKTGAGRLVDEGPKMWQVFGGDEEL
jgi:hypothetical protein